MFLFCCFCVVNGICYYNGGSSTTVCPYDHCECALQCYFLFGGIFHLSFSHFHIGHLNHSIAPSSLLWVFLCCYLSFVSSHVVCLFCFSGVWMLVFCFLPPNMALVLVFVLWMLSPAFISIHAVILKEVLADVLVVFSASFTFLALFCQLFQNLLVDFIYCVFYIFTCFLYCESGVLFFVYFGNDLDIDIS